VKIGSAQVNLLTSLRINRNPDSAKSCRTGIGHLDHLKALGALEAELGRAFPPRSIFQVRKITYTEIYADT
jgi:hypothetical protein